MRKPLVLFSALFLLLALLVAHVSGVHPGHDHTTHHAHASVTDCGAGTITSGTYLNTFDDAPSSPSACEPSDMEVTKHSRGNWYSPTDWSPQHGTDCAGYPAVHAIAEWDDTMFHCNGHIMTASNEGGFGATGFAPAIETDWSSSTAVIQWDVSTQMMSKRDWWEVFVSPLTVSGVQNYLQLPAEEADVDLAGFPLEGFRVRLQPKSVCTGTIGSFSFAQSRAGVVSGISKWANNSPSCDNHPTTLPASNTVRTTYRLELSNTVVGGVNKTHIKFFLPVQANVSAEWVWLDKDVDQFAFSTGLVQFTHRSYTPKKECDDGTLNPTPTPGTPGCWPGTWHWDTISIRNATALGLAQVTRETVDSTSGAQTLPHTNGGVLRMTCRSSSQPLQYSTNGGMSWTNVPNVDGSNTTADYGSTTGRMFAIPVPSGVSSLQFRAYGTSLSTAWACRNLYLWSA